MTIDHLAQLARLSEDALRSAALDTNAEASDALIARASERASLVEQLRAFDRPRNATATALPPSVHPLQSVEDTERALFEACQIILSDPDTPADHRRLVDRIASSCR